MKLGKDLIVLLDGTAIAAARTCSYSLNQEYIESASPTSGRTTVKIPTRYGWEVSTGTLCVDMNAAAAFINAIRNGSTFTLRFRDDTFTLDYTGTAILQSTNGTGDIGSLVSQTLRFVGSGELSEQAWTTITLTPTYTIDDVNINCNGTTPVLEHHEGDHVYVQQITVSVPTAIMIATTMTAACMFLHHASADTVAEKIQAIDTEAFLSSATTGYMAHVHGTSGMYRTVLQPGTYTITWDGSPTGTVKVKS